MRRGGAEVGAGVVERKRKVTFRDVVEQDDSDDDSTQIAQRRVPKASLVECLSCPLCDRLCRDASTIIECLHTCTFDLVLPSHTIRTFCIITHPGICCNLFPFRSLRNAKLSQTNETSCT